MFVGVIFDQSLSNCYSYWSRVAIIRRFLDEEECKEIVHASVISNVFLYGLPDSTLKILQRVQNYAARIVARLGRSKHIS